MTYAPFAASALELARRTGPHRDTMTTTHHQPRRLAGGELQPTIELAASIEAACAAYPSALRAPLARLCERHGLDVLGDLDALLATVAVYGFAEGER